MRVGYAEPQVRMPLSEPRDPPGILGGEGGDLVYVIGEILQQRQLRFDSRPAQQHVVKLGEHERRDDKGPCFPVKQVPDSGAVWFLLIIGGQQAAGVADDHSLPKPSASTSSTLWARPGSSNRIVPQRPRLRGRTSSVRCSIAVRMPWCVTSVRRRSPHGEALTGGHLAGSSRGVVTAGPRLGHPRPVVAVALTHLRGQGR